MLVVLALAGCTAVPAGAGAEPDWSAPPAPADAGGADPGGSPSAPVPLHQARRDIGFHDNTFTQVGTPAVGGLSFDRIASDMSRAGTTITRTTVSWAAAEPSAGTWSTSYFDRVRRYARALDEHGIRLVAVIGNAPAWARTSDGGKGWNAPRNDPNVMRAFGRFAGKVVDELAPTLVAVETWNEPNYSQFWGDTEPSPGVYAQLHIEASKQIRERAAASGVRMKVLLAGLVGVTADVTAQEGGLATYAWAQRYLLELFRNGVRPDQYDGVGLHLYPAQPGTGVDGVGEGSTQARSFQDVARAFDWAHQGRAQPRYWITETGVTTTGGTGGPPLACGGFLQPPCRSAGSRVGVSDAEQARWVSAILRKLASNDRVDGVFVHSLYDPVNEDSTSSERGFGLARVDGGGVGYKPSWCAIWLMTAPSVRDAMSGCEPTGTPEAAPAVRGTLRAGRVIRATVGSWRGDAPPLEIQWLRCRTASAAGCQPIPGRKGEAYRLRNADVRRWIAVRIRTLAGGRAEVVSKTVGAVKKRKRRQITKTRSRKAPRSIAASSTRSVARMNGASSGPDRRQVSRRT